MARIGMIGCAALVVGLGLGCGGVERADEEGLAIDEREDSALGGDLEVVVIEGAESELVEPEFEEPELVEPLLDEPELVEPRFDEAPLEDAVADGPIEDAPPIAEFADAPDPSDADPDAPPMIAHDPLAE